MLFEVAFDGEIRSFQSHFQCVGLIRAGKSRPISTEFCQVGGSVLNALQHFSWSAGTARLSRCGCMSWGGDRLFSALKLITFVQLTTLQGAIAFGFQIPVSYPSKERHSHCLERLTQGSSLFQSWLISILKGTNPSRKPLANYFFRPSLAASRLFIPRSWAHQKTFSIAKCLHLFVLAERGGKDVV